MLMDKIDPPICEKCGVDTVPLSVDDPLLFPSVRSATLRVIEELRKESSTALFFRCPECSLCSGCIPDRKRCKLLEVSRKCL